jgi:hypothetical protein
MDRVYHVVLMWGPGNEDMRICGALSGKNSPSESAGNFPGDARIGWFTSRVPGILQDPQDIGSVLPVGRLTEKTLLDEGLRFSERVSGLENFFTRKNYKNIFILIFLYSILTQTYRGMVSR